MADTKNHLARHRNIGQAIEANRSPTWWSNSKNRLRRRMHAVLSRASRRALKRHGEQLIEEALDDMHEEAQED
jgi:hypothetical protein